jgi:hypothetical protein
MVSKGKRGKPGKQGARLPAPDAVEPDKGGRPPVPDAERRDIMIRVLVNEGEQGELQRAAASESLPVSTWLRHIALEYAKALAAKKAKQEKQEAG